MLIKHRPSHLTQGPVYKVRKKNQPIWSLYEEEKQFTSFIRRLKTQTALAMN
jgi:hypothetical protein